MRSDRRGGRLRLWPSPPGRWRQHRVGCAGAGPEWGWLADERAAPALGYRRLDGRGASPRLAAARHVGRQVCAQTLESALVSGDVAFERLGLGLGLVPHGEGGAAGFPPPFSLGSGSRGETWGALPNPLGSRGSWTRDGRAACRGGAGEALPSALAGVSFLPPGGL